MFASGLASVVGIGTIFPQSNPAVREVQKLRVEMQSNFAVVNAKLDIIINSISNMNFNIFNYMSQQYVSAAKSKFDTAVTHLKTLNSITDISNALYNYMVVDLNQGIMSDITTFINAAKAVHDINIANMDPAKKGWNDNDAIVLESRHTLFDYVPHPDYDYYMASTTSTRHQKFSNPILDLPFSINDLRFLKKMVDFYFDNAPFVKSGEELKNYQRSIAIAIQQNVLSDLNVESKVKHAIENLRNQFLTGRPTYDDRDAFFSNEGYPIWGGSIQINTNDYDSMVGERYMDYVKVYLQSNPSNVLYENYGTASNNHGRISDGANSIYFLDMELETENIVSVIRPIYDKYYWEQLGLFVVEYLDLKVKLMSYMF